MLIQIVDNQVIPEKKEAYVKAAKEFAQDASANDAGCLGMSVWLDIARPDHVFIISNWKDAASMEASQSFLRHKKDLKPCFVGNTASVLELAE